MAERVELDNNDVWVIVLDEGYWLSVDTPEYFRGIDDGQAMFTNDLEKASHFCGKKSAESLLEHGSLLGQRVMLERISSNAV